MSKIPYKKLKNSFDIFDKLNLDEKDDVIEALRLKLKELEDYWGESVVLHHLIN